MYACIIQHNKILQDKDAFISSVHDIDIEPHIKKEVYAYMPMN